jgi:hypothetical protein
MWFVGIDWGDAFHEVAALDEHGGSAGTLRVAHTADGLQELLELDRAMAGVQRAEDFAGGEIKGGVEA